MENEKAANYTRLERPLQVQLWEEEKVAQSSSLQLVCIRFHTQQFISRQGRSRGAFALTAISSNSTAPTRPWEILVFTHVGSDP
jgi:hypothetical protein